MAPSDYRIGTKLQCLGVVTLLLLATCTSTLGRTSFWSEDALASSGLAGDSVATQQPVDSHKRDHEHKYHHKESADVSSSGKGDLKVATGDVASNDGVKKTSAVDESYVGEEGTSRKVQPVEDHHHHHKTSSSKEHTSALNEAKNEPVDPSKDVVEVADHHEHKHEPKYEHKHEHDLADTSSGGAEGVDGSASGTGVDSVKAVDESDSLDKKKKKKKKNEIDLEDNNKKKKNEIDSEDNKKKKNEIDSEDKKKKNKNDSEDKKKKKNEALP